MEVWLMRGIDYWRLCVVHGCGVLLVVGVDKIH